MKLLLGFAPWLAFLLIAQGSLLRLKIGLVVALALSVVMGITRLHRGVILWVGLLFFASTTVAVVAFDNAWVARTMGLLANGALAVCVWLTILAGKPFTLDYARARVERARWNDPIFIRSNVVISTVWALVFTVNAGLAYGKMMHAILPSWTYEVVAYALLVGAVGFTMWYPAHIAGSQRNATRPADPASGGDLGAGRLLF